jgi:Domain of unknown function (DUF4375)
VKRAAMICCAVLCAAACKDAAKPKEAAKPKPFPVAKCKAQQSPAECAVAALFEKIPEDDRGALAAFKSYSAGQQALYAIWVVDGEVRNGGFNQYFFNGGGDSAQAAADGFRLVGSEPHAKLVDEAIAAYRKDKARMDATRAQGSLEAFSESYKDDPYDALDSAWYKLASPTELADAYVKKHPEQFPGVVQ